MYPNNTRHDRDHFFSPGATSLIVLFFLLAGVLLWKIAFNARVYVYGAARECLKAYVVAGSWQMEKLTSDHFYLKYWPENRAEAEMVLETAERFYGPVAEDFSFKPRGKIPVILYQSREELNNSFGWEATESAMGVYWAGAIRVLSPREWIDEKDPARVRELFASSGPMAHEFTHLAVDYRTGGNYPRWFTEGVAQYEEYKLTGFHFNDPSGSLNRKLYSMEDLTGGFDELPDQSLAYRESFAAVSYIVNVYGEDMLHKLVRQLGLSRDFDSALQEVLGIGTEELETRWQAWAMENQDPDGQIWMR